MRAYAPAVLWRYVALAGQFAIVLLVTINAELSVVGQYFSLFGFNVVASLLVGFGAPDGFVRLSGLLQSLGHVAERHVAKITLFWGVGATVVAAVLAGIVGALAGFPAVTLSLAILWWMEYAIVFALAQLLVGFGNVSWGSFIAYSAINISYMVTLAPYIIVVESPTLQGLLGSAVVGGCLAVALGLVAVSRGWPTKAAMTRSTASSSALLGSRALLTAGLPISVSRMLQGALPWTPVWVLTFGGDAANAAIYGSASRLTVVVTSVLASLRFATRLEIVAANNESRFREIESLSRRASLLGFLAPIAGLVFLALFGLDVIPFVMGEDYISAIPVLMILMFGVMAEAVGGLSDEILKMTGRVHVVLGTLLAAVALQCGALVGFRAHGPTTLAWITVAAFAVQYAAQVIWLRFMTPISLWPSVLGRRVDGFAA